MSATEFVRLRLAEDEPGKVFSLVRDVESTPSSHAPWRVSRRQVLCGDNELRLLRLDCEAEAVRIEAGGREVEVSIDAVREVRFEIGPELGELVHLWLHLNLDLDEDGDAELMIPFTVVDLDLRREAMDLLFRLGRVLGFSRYHLRRHSPEHIDVVLTRHDRQAPPEGPFRARGDGPDIYPIPAVSEPCHYADDSWFGSLDSPDDPVILPHQSPQVVEWRPREQVSLTTHGGSWGKEVFMRWWDGEWFSL